MCDIDVQEFYKFLVYFHSNNKIADPVAVMTLLLIMKHLYCNRALS